MALERVRQRTSPIKLTERIPAVPELTDFGL
jgi:hypothetical protein